jgi:hypothetical protein
MSAPLEETDSSYGQVDLENLRANAMKSTAIETSRAKGPRKLRFRNGLDKRAKYDIWQLDVASTEVVPVSMIKSDGAVGWDRHLVQDIVLLSFFYFTARFASQ